MDDEQQRNLPSIYGERITRVEERVERVTVEQVRLSNVVDRQTSILDALLKQINADEQAAVAIRERTDNHAKNIEHLQLKEVDNSKILDKHENDIQSFREFVNNFWSFVRWLGVAVGGSAIGYAFSHFIH